MTDTKIVNRIARVYYHKYTKEGYQAAVEYADRIFAGQPELREEVKEAIGTLLKKKGINHK